MFYSYVFAMLVGWCGNEPRPFPWPKNPPLPPVPDPDPCPVCGKFGSIAGGLISYVILSQVFPNDTGVAATFAAGFVGGRIGGQLGSYLGGMLKGK